MNRRLNAKPPTLEETQAALEALMPTDPLMHAMWGACLHYCATDPERLAEFRAATGNNWTPSRSPIGQMVDQACGVEQDFILSLAKWMNANVWGEIDGRGVNGNEVKEGESEYE